VGADEDWGMAVGLPTQQSTGCSGGIKSDGSGHASAAGSNVSSVSLGVGGEDAMREMVRVVEEWRIGLVNKSTTCKKNNVP